MERVQNTLKLVMLAEIVADLYEINDCCGILESHAYQSDGGAENQMVWIARSVDSRNGLFIG